MFAYKAGSFSCLLTKLAPFYVCLQSWHHFMFAYKAGTFLCLLTKLAPFLCLLTKLAPFYVCLQSWHHFMFAYIAGTFLLWVAPSKPSDDRFSVSLSQPSRDGSS
jgi:hypothetical protein